ncbi:hypothetical protein ACWKWA_04425 [Dermacoccus abyssi]
MKDWTGTHLGGANRNEPRRDPRDRRPPPAELLHPDPPTACFSLLRIFNPSIPTHDIHPAKSHLKHALDSRRPG